MNLHRISLNHEVKYKNRQLFKALDITERYINKTIVEYTYKPGDVMTAKKKVTTFQMKFAKIIDFAKKFRAGTQFLPDDFKLEIIKHFKVSSSQTVSNYIKVLQAQKLIKWTGIYWEVSSRRG